MKRILITCGDINGIGPEISLKLISRVLPSTKHQIIFLCPYNIFLESCELLSFKLEHAKIKNADDLEVIQNQLVVFDTGKIKAAPGKNTASAGKSAFRTLESAMLLLNNGFADVLVTAPISKQSMKMSGFNFPGHTEYLASKTNSKNFLMMFVSNKLKCALTTIHIPLKDVAKSISAKLVNQKLDIISSSLKNDFGIINPQIAVLGLNPHAGENGVIGKEELCIEDAIRAHSPIAFGPFVPDAFFANKMYRNFDIVLGMYHDQVLIPFKMLDFMRGVNYTAGLPFVRTSPDHGTGLDIAWQNKANSLSMESAFKWAVHIGKYRSPK